MEISQKYTDLNSIGAFSGAENFRKSSNCKTDLKNVRAELSKVKAYNLHFPAPKKIKRRFVYVPGIHVQYGMDLIDIQKYKKSNYGNSYILIVLDFFSKMAWLESIKNKKATTVLEAFQRILKRTGGKCQFLHSDSGTEFINSKMKKFCEDNNIKQFSVTTPLKCCYVERFIRTIFQKISRYMTHKNTKRFVNKLKEFETLYQNSYHRSIGCKPIEVTKTNEMEIWHKLYSKKEMNKPKSDLKVGDKVHRVLDKPIFTKGYSKTFEDEIYEIESIRDTNPPMYKIKDEKRSLPRYYYRQELVTVNYSTE